MDPINIGFKSVHWIKLMESTEYSELAKAIDEDNQGAMAAIYAALRAIFDGDSTSSMSRAHHALQLAKNGPHGQHSVKCPFCDGTGSIQIEYNSKGDAPEDIKSVDASCSACDGTGQINISRMFSGYLGSTYPENGVIAILDRKFEDAKQIANAVFSEIKKHEHTIKQKSLDDYFRA